MSHIGVRILSNWLAGTTQAAYGVNILAADVPRLVGHSAPPAVSIYDETQHDWLAQREVPDADDATAGITFPLIAVVLDRGDFDAGRGKVYDSAVVANGQLRIITQIFLRGADTATQLVSSMYLARALRGSLITFDNAVQADRTLCYTTLQASLAISQSTPKPELEDLVCVASIGVTYPVWESTPLTGQ